MVHDREARLMRLSRGVAAVVDPDPRAVVEVYVRSGGASGALVYAESSSPG